MWRVLFGVWLVYLASGSALAASCTLMILGDSLSSGYGLAPGTGWVDRLDARLRQRAPSWRVVNASISGDTTQNGLQRLGPALARHRPAGVIIELGGNDALRGMPPDTLRGNLTALVRQARAAGAWVLLLEAPVLPNYGPGYARAVRAAYAGVARAEHATPVPCFVCAVALHPGMMQADAIHPNEQAQPAMLDAVWAHLGARLRCPAP